MIQRIATICLVFGIALLVANQNSAFAQAPEKPLPAPPLPLSTPATAAYLVQQKPLSFAQQQARFEAEQRMLRMEWNNWIGYSPARPNMNSSYMSNGLQRYYVPSRGAIVSVGNASAWYW